MQAGSVDGFVTAGGGIEKEILFDFPDIVLAAKLPAITSDMTFAVLKDRAMLGEVINSYIDQNTATIQSLAREAREQSTTPSKTPRWLSFISTGWVTPTS